MHFTTVKNRLGELVFNSSLLTDEVRRMLVRFNEDNAGLLNQECLMCSIGFIHDELADTCLDSTSFAISVAIFANSKRYLITDEDAFSDEMNLLDVEMCNGYNGCWVPDGIPAEDMWFVFNDPAVA